MRRVEAIRAHPAGPPIRLRVVRYHVAGGCFQSCPSGRVKIIVETIDASPEIAEQTLKLFFEPERHVLPHQAEINLKGLAQVIAFMGEAGTIKEPLPASERFVDLQYLRLAGIK